MFGRLVYRLYNLLVLFSLPFIALGVLVKWRSRFAKGVERWSERRGFLSPEQKALLQQGEWWWVHAVSLGEVKAIEVFLREAPSFAKIHIFLTLVTPEALVWAAEAKLAHVIAAAPIDLPWIVRRVCKAVHPRVFVSVESEFWPNLLREAKRSGTKVALMNGRISEKSYQSYLRIRPLLSVLWENFHLLAVRQHEDASRFVTLGVPHQLIHVTGNMKYDLPLPKPDTHTTVEPNGLTVVVGSSREGEEKELLPILRRLQADYSKLSVIWAPRHIDRVKELEALFTAQGVPCTRKSDGDMEKSSHVLWDTMGDLVEAYKRADVALIGGSFVPKGGQNPIEPAALRVPVVFGPSMENFHGIAEVLVQQGGARQVTLAELPQCLQDLLKNPSLRVQMGERARQAVESRQGATAKTLSLLKELAHA